MTKFDLANAVRLSPALKFLREAGSFSGYASTFSLDRTGERVAPGAFTSSLALWETEEALPPLLWSHDPSEPIGHLTELREDDKGLFVVGEFNLETSAGREAHLHAKAGDVNGLSIGFRVLKSKRDPDGTNILTELDLLEVSIVALPANRRARINSVKELERALTDILPHRAAEKVAPVAYKALISKPIDLDQLARRIEATIKAVKGE